MNLDIKTKIYTHVNVEKKQTNMKLVKKQKDGNKQIKKINRASLKKE